MNGMVWVRIIIGAVWINGALEKILNPGFPRQFAASLQVGGFVSQAPSFFRSFMQGTVAPNAETFAQLMRVGELALGIALVLGIFTSLAALGSIALSVVILLSQGGVRFGTGLGPPEFLTINVIIALLSLIVLISPESKKSSANIGFPGRKRGSSSGSRG